MGVEGGGDIVLFNTGSEPYSGDLAMIAWIGDTRIVGRALAARVEGRLVPGEEESGAPGVPGLSVHYFWDQRLEEEVALTDTCRLNIRISMGTADS